MHETYKLRAFYNIYIRVLLREFRFTIFDLKPEKLLGFMGGRGDEFFDLMYGDFD